MYSNVLSIVVLTCAIMIAILVLAVHIIYGSKIWGKEKFKAYVGASLEGSTVTE